jgi:hypothetical protein
LTGRSYIVRPEITQLGVAAAVTIQELPLLPIPQSLLRSGQDTAILALADGTIFTGYSIGAAGHTLGEVVFNTSMTGYQEILTDPSYSSQIVTLTYPHIGNTGVNSEDVESDKIHAAGLIIKDLPQLVSISAPNNPFLLTSSLKTSLLLPVLIPAS